MPYEPQVPDFAQLGVLLNSELSRLFPSDVEIIAEPGRFMVATAATLVSEIIGKARREGKVFYHINDGVYHTFSGVVYDHWIPNFRALKEGRPEICAVVGPTCDSFDKISLSVPLPWNLDVGDYLITDNIGAYSIAASTRFNGFDGAKVLHTHLRESTPGARDQIRPTSRLRQSVAPRYQPRSNVHSALRGPFGVMTAYPVTCRPDGWRPGPT